MSSISAADAAVDLAVQLVRIDSVNPALVPGAAGERGVVELLASRLGARGFAIEVVEAAVSGRPSLVATHRGTGGGRSLLLNGHLDTVGLDGDQRLLEARVVGDPNTGRLEGRGACDMKGGVAAMVAAAETAADIGTGGDVVLALVADEEHASIGTEAVLAHLADRLPDACLVGEPTWLDLAVAHRGYAVVEVELTGRGGHSSEPALGVNAVTHLGRLLAAVEARDAELAAGPAHSLAGAGSLMATVANGGTSPFVLAASASAVVERRTVPGEAAAQGLADVQALLAAMHRDDPTVDGAALLALSREAWQHDPSSPAGSDLAAALWSALATHAGRTPDRVGVPYWMESALWEAAGVPTVVCGPAGGGLHAADEWLDLTQLRAYTGALVDVIGRFCGQPTSGRGDANLRVGSVGDDEREQP